MRRKTSVPEIRDSSHRISYMQQTTVHHEATRMDTDDGHRDDRKVAVTSLHTNTSGVHPCTQCGIDFPSLDGLKKHEFLDHSNWGNHGQDDHLDSPLEPKAKGNHHAPPAEFNGIKQETNQTPKNNSEEEADKKDISIFTCQLCGAAFFDKCSLDHHKDMHTKAMTPPPPPPTSTAAAAVKTNSSSSPYVTQPQNTMKNCKYCGEGFLSQAALAQHEHAHELVTKDVANHQVYKCRHCEHKFDRFCDMMQHERTHVGEDMFQWQLDGQGPKRARGRPPKAAKKPNWQVYAEIDQYLSDTMPSSPGSPRRGRRPKVRKYTKHNRPGSHIKRAKTAYFYFLEEFRKQYRTEAGWNCKASEITKACGTKWNSMNDSERKPYVAQAVIDRERYESEISVFKKERDPEKPKKPPTAFFFFLTDFRAQMAGQKIETGRRLTEICGEQWNKLTEAQKSPYMNVYAAEVKKYQDAMEEYKSRKATASENLGPQWRSPGRPVKQEMPPYDMTPSPM
ncbi:uncharacterized protein [Amphiura filiformis]|uniref:uncharacterized protein isoform X2 n=1 Tax=Amphiura filiformis TaxID=82378 RepID=UPI003B21FB80